jgi:hypothetical protein
MVSEALADALQQYQNLETETDPSEDYDATVFDTITSLMGRNITNRMVRFTHLTVIINTIDYYY